MAAATEPAAGGRRLPLALRIFGLIALLLGIAVGGAVLLGYQHGGRIADRAVQRALDGSVMLQSEFSEKLLQELQFKVQLLAGDASFVKYIADAREQRLGLAVGGDDRSIQDLLLERQQTFGFGLGMVLDVDGEVLARSDRIEALRESLRSDPFFAAAHDPPAPISGYWRRGDQLYLAAIWPLAQGNDLIGFLLLASEVDDQLGERVAQAGDADIAFLLPVGPRTEIIGSSLDQTQREGLQGALGQGGIADAVRQAKPLARIELSLADGRWVGRLAPLDAEGGGRVGAALQLTSADQAAAGYRAIVDALAWGGLGTVVLALPLSLWLTKVSLRPLGAMARAAQAAAGGEFGARIAVPGNDELADLSRAIDSLLSDLRGERDIESYVSHLTRLLPEGSGASSEAPASARLPALRGRLLLLALEHRALDAQCGGLEAEAALARLECWSVPLVADARGQGGLPASIAGGRLLLAFEAGDGLATALRVLAGAWAREPALAAALVEGEAVLGGNQAGDLLLPAAFGPAVDAAWAALAGIATGQAGLDPALVPAAASLLDRPPTAAMVAGDLGVLAGDAAVPAAAGFATQLVGTSPARAAGSEVLHPGTRFGGRYQILAVLGHGGMGVVYKARDAELDELVALKTLRPAALADGGQLERLKSEIRLARRITHPNVLRTYDFGEAGGLPYISMEYVRGMTLRFLMQQADRVPFTAALRIARQLCAGLHAVHEIGVLHRDIKPENVILEASGNAKLIDFGIARPARRDGHSLTEAGSFVGTPQYCAPEQLAGREIDRRADIYACGVLMYELFCAGLPFAGQSAVELYQAQMGGPPQPPSVLWPAIPAALEAILLRCLERDPAARYPDLGPLIADLAGLRA